MNICVFSGNISRLGDLNESAGGTQFIKFTVAVNRRAKNEKADFVSMTAFGNTAKFVSMYCKVGSKVTAQTHYQQSVYEKDGKKNYSSDFIVDSLEKHGKNDEPTEAKKEDYGFVNVADNLEDDGLPFN